MPKPTARSLLAGQEVSKGGATRAADRNPRAVPYGPVELPRQPPYRGANDPWVAGLPAPLPSCKPVDDIRGGRPRSPSAVPPSTGSANTTVPSPACDSWWLVVCWWCEELSTTPPLARVSKKLATVEKAEGSTGAPLRLLRAGLWWLGSGVGVGTGGVKPPNERRSNGEYEGEGIEAEGCGLQGAGKGQGSARSGPLLLASSAHGKWAVCGHATEATTTYKTYPTASLPPQASQVEGDASLPVRAVNTLGSIFTSIRAMHVANPPFVCLQSETGCLWRHSVRKAGHHAQLLVLPQPSMLASRPLSSTLHRPHLPHTPRRRMRLRRTAHSSPTALPRDRRWGPRSHARLLRQHIVDGHVKAGLIRFTGARCGCCCVQHDAPGHAGRAAGDAGGSARAHGQKGRLVAAQAHRGVGAAALRWRAGRLVAGPGHPAAAGVHGARGGQAGLAA